MKKKPLQMLFLTLLFCIFSAINANAATVSNPSEVTLKPGIYYSGYDITGDQIADSILISKTSSAYDISTGLEIRINGKTAYSFNDKYSYYYDVEAKLYTLQNHKVYLYLYAMFNNYDGPVCGIFSYQNGKLKQLLNLQTYFRYGIHRYGKVVSVYGNYLTVDMFSMSYAMGPITIEMTFQSKGNKLKPVSNSATVISYAGSSKPYVTVRSKLTLYKSATSSSKYFTLTANTPVRVTGCYVKGTNVRYRLMRLSDGKTGWAKSPIKLTGSSKPWFNEAFYAG